MRAELERAIWSEQGKGHPEHGRAKQNQARQGRWDQAPQGRAEPGQAGQGLAKQGKAGHLPSKGVKKRAMNM